MKTTDEITDKDVGEMRDAYDFSGGTRGKYAERYAEGTNLVLLDPDLAALFPSSEAVNRALRALAEVARAHTASEPE